MAIPTPATANVAVIKAPKPVAKATDYSTIEEHLQENVSASTGFTALTLLAALQAKAEQK